MTTLDASSSLLLFEWVGYPCFYILLPTVKTTNQIKDCKEAAMRLWIKQMWESTLLKINTHTHHTQIVVHLIWFILLALSVI